MNAYYNWYIIKHDLKYICISIILISNKYLMTNIYLIIAYNFYLKLSSCRIINIRIILIYIGIEN